MRRWSIYILGLFFVLAGAISVMAAAGPPEIVKMRTESAKFYPAADGQTRGDFYTGPIHYQNTAGEWKDIDLNAVDLARVPDDDDNVGRFGLKAGNPSGNVDEELGVIEDATGQVRLYKKQFAFGVLKNKYGFLAPQAANGAYAFCLNDRQRIVVKPLKAKMVGGHRDKSALLYKDAWNGASLEYVVGTSRLKENIILASPQSPLEYEFMVKAYGLTPRKSADGLLEFVDEQEQSKASMPAPFLKDASGTISSDLQATVDVKGRVAHVKIRINEAWLNDPRRVFPVILDPTTKTYSPSQDAYVDEYSDTEKKGQYRFRVRSSRNLQGHLYIGVPCMGIARLRSACIADQHLYSQRLFKDVLSRLRKRPPKRQNAVQASYGGLFQSMA